MTDNTPVRVVHPLVAFRETMVAQKSEIAAALPPQVNVDRFIRTVMTTVNMNQALLSADRKSLTVACMRSAQTGLFPDGQDAAFVMFGQQVTFMPMVGGLMKLARQSGEIVTLTAHCVYSKDRWEYQLGDDEFIRHQPSMDADRGSIIAAYAIGKTKAGGVFREVLTASDIEKIRNVSKSKNNGPWVQWPDRMAEKSVMRRLLKRMPSSTDLDVALEDDNEGTDFNQRETMAATIITETQAPLSRLKASLALSEEPAEQPLSDDPDVAALQAAERHALREEGR